MYRSRNWPVFCPQVILFIFLTENGGCLSFTSAVSEHATWKVTFQVQECFMLSPLEEFVSIHYFAETPKSTQPSHFFLSLYIVIVICAAIRHALSCAYAREPLECHAASYLFKCFTELYTNPDRIWRLRILKARLMNNWKIQMTRLIAAVTEKVMHGLTITSDHLCYIRYRFRYQGAKNWTFILTFVSRWHEQRKLPSSCRVRSLIMLNAVMTAKM